MSWSDGVVQHAICWAAAMALFCVANPMGAQVPAICPDAALESSLRFFDAPGDVRVIALEYRNISEMACSLPALSVPESPFVADHQPIPLEPGQQLHATVRWKMKAPEGVACKTMNWFRFETPPLRDRVGLIDSPILAPPACSEPLYTRLAPGVYEPEWPFAHSLGRPLPTAPVASMTKDVYLRDETIDLVVKLMDRADDDPRCPVVLIRETEADGTTRLDEEVNPVRGCNWFSPFRRPRPGIRNEYPLEARSLRELGHRRYEALQLDGVEADGELRVVVSKPVEVTVSAVDSRARTWSRAEKGVRAALDLDRRVYSMGADVPLHLAVENVDASLAVYPEPFTIRGEFLDHLSRSLEIKVLGPDGWLKPLPPRFGWGGSSGPATCPHSMDRGQPIFRETTLQVAGLLPQKPGKYQVFVSWSPYTSEAKECEQRQPEPGSRDIPFVTVTAVPVTFQVVSK